MQSLHGILCKLCRLTQDTIHYTKKPESFTLSQTTNFSLIQTEEFADNNFKFDVSGRKFFKLVENTVGKGEIAQ